MLFRMWWAKHLTGFCATGQQMSNRGEWESPSCPCCEQGVEGSTRHMWACTHPEMFEFRQSAYLSFMEWLEGANLAPEIVQMFSWVLNTGPGAQTAVGNRGL